MKIMMKKPASHRYRSALHDLHFNVAAASLSQFVS
jgi:hypothetical protein